ncbi:MlaD family protein [Chitinimonas sp. BJYL2]|uniref:MlaD family protein n=1 Tax=Chitinimonas sp. BJYL2 TaxID=2976696 RepID=UPI0022B3FA40|nr:MlaD family protein [Chitinimonas sp. BJYL2]
MPLLRDDDPRFRALPWKLALFVLTALAGAALVIVFFAWRQGYFEAKTPLTFISDSGNDLRLGMAVKFSGFKIGDVTDLKLDERGRVRIAVMVEDRHLKWIKSDSVGRVAKDGLIGDGYIDVGIGNPRFPPVDRNAELEFIPAKSMDEILREVRDRAMPTLVEVERLIQRINNPEGDLHQTLVNLRQFSAGLSDTRSKLDQALDSVNHLAANEVPATLANTRQALESADASLRLLESRLPTLLDKTDQTLGHVESMAGIARKVLEQSGPDIVGLAHEGHQLTRKGNQAVDAVTGAWPLNRLISPAPEQLPRSDSQGLTP